MIFWGESDLLSIRLYGQSGSHVSFVFFELWSYTLFFHSLLFRYNNIWQRFEPKVAPMISTIDASANQLFVSPIGCYVFVALQFLNDGSRND